MTGLVTALVVGVSSPAEAAVVPEAEAQVVVLVNQERAAVGCPALQTDARLVTAARAHSQDMAVRAYFAHTDPDGTNPFARMTAFGYPLYSGMAENIGAGQRTAAEVVAAWMASPPHRANILNCAYVAVGTGAWTGGSYGVYWTQDFGTVAPAVVAASVPVRPAPVAVSR